MSEKIIWQGKVEDGEASALRSVHVFREARIMHVDTDDAEGAYFEIRKNDGLAEVTPYDIAFNTVADRNDTSMALQAAEQAICGLMKALRHLARERARHLLAEASPKESDVVECTDLTVRDLLQTYMGVKDANE